MDHPLDDSRSHGLDLTDKDQLDPTEAQAFRNFYTRRYGAAHPGLNFWMDNGRPDVLKRYRAVAQAMSTFPDGSEFQTGFLWTNFYSAIGFTAYIPRQARMLQNSGLSRDEIIELYAIASMNSGPHGMETIADGLQGFEWSEPTGTYPWPSTWSYETDVLRSGIDFESPTLTDDERTKVLDWYVRVTGEVPGHIQFLARHEPHVLKAYRDRFENVVTCLPVQVLPVMLLHYALMNGSDAEIRDNVLLARGLGVSLALVAQVSTSTIIYGLSGLSRLQSIARDVLDDWDSRPS